MRRLTKKRAIELAALARMRDEDIDRISRKLGMPVTFEHICLPPSPVILSDLIFHDYSQARAQSGNFAAKKVNDVTCSATDNEGRKYELLFVSDGTPVSVRRIRQSQPSFQDPFK